jgi:hypothetical protein
MSTTATKERKPKAITPAQEKLLRRLGDGTVVHCVGSWGGGLHYFAGDRSIDLKEAVIKALIKRGLLTETATRNSYPEKSTIAISPAGLEMLASLPPEEAPKAETWYRCDLDRIDTVEVLKANEHRLTCIRENGATYTVDRDDWSPTREEAIERQRKYRERIARQAADDMERQRANLEHFNRKFPKETP